MLLAVPFGDVRLPAAENGAKSLLHHHLLSFKSLHMHGGFVEWGNKHGVAEGGKAVVVMKGVLIQRLESLDPI